jgi:hypothetical protein
MHTTPTTLARLVVTGAVALGLTLPMALDVPGGAAAPAESATASDENAQQAQARRAAKPCVRHRMGIPRPGKTYLGAVVWGTSGDVGSRERELGRTIRLHRTYYQASQIKGATRDARADLRAGRMSWMSFKAPLSWGEMARGEGNGWVHQLANHLGRVGGPVWLAVHHEPENDGDMRLWTQMQRQIARIIHAETDNVAYTVIYAGWNTFGGDNNTIATKWPGDQYVDVLAIDAYNDFGVVRDGRVGTKHLKLRPYYRKMARWSRKHGTAWAIGETGQSVRGAEVDPTWLDRAYHSMRKMGGAGLSYYDSSAHSVTDWTLDDPVKFQRFKGLQRYSARVC